MQFYLFFNSILISFIYIYIYIYIYIHLHCCYTSLLFSLKVSSEKYRRVRNTYVLTGWSRKVNYWPECSKYSQNYSPWSYDVNTKVRIIFLLCSIISSKLQCFRKKRIVCEIYEVIFAFGFITYWKHIIMYDIFWKVEKNIYTTTWRATQISRNTATIILLYIDLYIRKNIGFKCVSAYDRKNLSRVKYRFYFSFPNI